jgi:hypothetical protein
MRGRLDVARHGLDANAGEDDVECGGEVRPAVADHELDPAGLFAESLRRLRPAGRPAGQRLNRADTCMIVKSQSGALSRGHFNGLAGPTVVV